jgi:hypothetical protein
MVKVYFFTLKKIAQMAFDFLVGVAGLEPATADL